MAKELFTRADLKRLILPLIIEQVLSATVGVADTLMVSSCGEAAVSGVSLVDSVNLLLVQLFASLGTGGAIVASQYLGREDDANANKAGRQLLLIMGTLSLALMAVGLCWRAQILSGLFGAAEPAVMQNANLYMFYSSLSYPFIAVYSGAAALFRAMGNSRISMLAALVMNVINIGGNALTIFVLGWGVAGAAIASLLSRVVSAAILVLLLRNRHNRIQIRNPLRLGFLPHMIRNILYIAVPTGVETSIFQVGKLMVQSLVTSFGTVALAANAVGSSMMIMTQMPGSAIGLAMITVVGQCIGAGDYGQAKRYMIKLTGLSYLLMGILNLGIILSLPWLVGLFSLSAEGARLAWQVCMVCCVSDILFWSAGFTLPNGLRAANDVRYTMVVSIVSMWLCRVGLGYVFGRTLGLGVLGVWLAMSIDWIFRLAFFVGRLVSGRWQRNRVLE